MIIKYSNTTSRFTILKVLITKNRIQINFKHTSAVEHLLSCRPYSFVSCPQETSIPPLEFHADSHLTDSESKQFSL